jgi:hypothetical protein
VSFGERAIGRRSSRREGGHGLLAAGGGTRAATLERFSPRSSSRSTDRFPAPLQRSVPVHTAASILGL